MQSEPKKILVVDDDPDILEFLRELLRLEGYAIMVTDKAEHLEKMLDSSLPNLILLDVLLSGKDGREIVKDLKSRAETMLIPIIMFSAHPRAEETALAAGADDFVAKPFEVDELLEKIAMHVKD
jgi:DNA-binding response OmpR family regulator